MGENGDGDAEAVTRQDLNQFRDFLLDQLKSHTSELSSKFNKAAFDAESALSVSKQVKAENDLKLITQATEGTINSISRFWSFLRSFRKLSTLKKRSKRPSFWISQFCHSRNATEKLELLIPPTAVG